MSVIKLLIRSDKWEKKITHSLRIGFSILLSLVLAWILITNQKDINTANSGQIFYYQGKPGTLFFVLFACTVAIYFYIFSHRHIDHPSEQIMKRWGLIVNTLSFIILLPLQFFSMDSYFYVSEKEIVESRFWKLDDQEKLDWHQLKKSILKIIGDETDPKIRNQLVFANGKSYNLNVNLMDKEDFVRLIQFLHKHKQKIEVVPLTAVQEKVIQKLYGDDMLKLLLNK